MVIAAKAGANLGFSDEDCTNAIIEANKNNRLPCECVFTADSLAEAALSDKKRTGDTVTFVFPRKIGECYLKKIPVEMIYKIAE